MVEQVIGKIIEQYGAWAAWAATMIYLLLSGKIGKGIIPVLSKKFQEEEKRRAEERADEKRREDRLFELLTNVTKVMEGLRVTIENVNKQLSELSSVTKGISEDVSGLYGHINVERPSLTPKTVTTKDDEKKKAEP